MRFLINITGRRNRTMSKLIETLIEEGELSTPQVVDKINTKIGRTLSVTTTQVSNWLPKSGCFIRVGKVKKLSSLSGDYFVTLWRADFNGIRNKYGVAEVDAVADKTGRVSYRLQYVLDAEAKTMTSVSELIREGIWDEIQETLERDEKSNL